MSAAEYDRIRTLHSLTRNMIRHARCWGLDECYIEELEAGLAEALDTGWADRLLETSIPAALAAARLASEAHEAA
jgi:hypothetical protein